MSLHDKRKNTLFTPSTAYVAPNNANFSFSDDFLKNANFGQQRLNTNNTSPGSGFGMNLDTFNMAGNAIGGLGKLASGWAALKGIGLAEDQLGFQQDAFNKNFAMQEAAYGNRVSEANARIDDMNNFKSVGKRAGGYVQQDRLTA